MQLDLFSILLSVIAGLISTGLMTLIEIPFWKKWKLTGILEWHENQILTCKIFKIPNNKNYFWGIFFLHFLNGGLGGIGLLLALVLFTSLYEIPLLIIGLLYGFFLWTLTLLPIHKPITGINPLNHPLGHGPIIISLLGHAVYGITLGIIFSLMISPK
ncbi:MAG TPA: hypothetical protein VFM31_05600 [Nitrososphaeraceae archaeon]|nr:hypothetical protein [Nitrososphaeraceae archaeon]